MSLPNELLVHVLTLSLPTGFEPFMLTCKRVYAVGANLIAAHNGRKKRWSTIVIGGWEQDLVDAMAFLYEFAVKDPLAPAYVKELRVGFRPIPDEAKPRTLNEENYYWWRDDLSIYRMRDLVTTSWYLRASGVNVENWADKMFESKHLPEFRLPRNMSRNLESSPGCFT